MPLGAVEIKKAGSEKSEYVKVKKCYLCTAAGYWLLVRGIMEWANRQIKYEPEVVWPLLQQGVPALDLLYFPLQDRVQQGLGVHVRAYA